MKLRKNLNEKLETVIDVKPAEAKALAEYEEAQKRTEERMNNQDEEIKEFIKDYASEESKTRIKIKDRKELSKKITEAKANNIKFKISRCNEDGYRYIFESFNTNLLNEDKSCNEEECAEKLEKEPEVEKPFEKEEEKKLLLSQDKCEGCEEKKETEEVKKELKETFAGEDIIKDLTERAQSMLKDGGYGDKEECVRQAIDDGLIYTKDIYDLLEHYATISDSDIIQSYYEDLFSDVLNGLEEVEPEEEFLEESKKDLKEEDKPATQSIEDCQKWIDFDMKHYGHISERTNEIVKKAGFQIIKDDHGDYEVTAGKFESLKEAEEVEEKEEVKEVEKKELPVEEVEETETEETEEEVKEEEPTVKPDYVEDEEEIEVGDDYLDRIYDEEDLSLVDEDEVVKDDEDDEFAFVDEWEEKPLDIKDTVITDNDWEDIEPVKEETDAHQAFTKVDLEKISDIVPEAKVEVTTTKTTPTETVTQEVKVTPVADDIHSAMLDDEEVVSDAEVEDAVDSALEEFKK